MDYKISEATSEAEFRAEMDRRWVDKEDLPTRIVGSRRALLNVLNWMSVATRYSLGEETYDIGNHYVILPYAKLQLAEAE